MANIINADNGVVSLIPGLKTSADASGVLEIQNNGVTSLTVAPSGISVPEGSIKPLVSGTAVTLTNQTNVDFTAIPSWVKRITYMFDGVSLSGTDSPLIQLGYGATPAYVTSGYSGSAQSLTTTPGSGVSQFGTGFPIRSITAVDGVIGVMTLVLLNPATNTWLASYNGYNSAIASSWSNGSIALSGTLTAVRLTRTGTNTFDAGTVNILYE